MYYSIFVCNFSFIFSFYFFVGNANTCRQVSNHSTLRDITWSTHNCLITFDTIGIFLLFYISLKYILTYYLYFLNFFLGIWPETVDGIDLTTGCKNVSNTLFVSGDDFGKIKVYSYPVCWPKVRNALLHSSEEYFLSKNYFSTLYLLLKSTFYVFLGQFFNIWWAQLSSFKCDFHEK